LFYINIQARQNQSGLQRSAELLADVLRSAGWAVTINVAHRSLVTHIRHKAAKLTRNHAYDLNIFLEEIKPFCLPLAKRQILVPNQEWLRDTCSPYLDEIHAVLCKTRYAEKIFREAGFPTTFISFTSADRYDAGCRRNYDAFFHLAGSSDQKGTAPLVDLWRAHPEWPTLTIVQHPNNRLDVQAPNITYISEHIDDEKLRRLQNEMGVHVCPSEAEGFGHSIVEAMSCRALVVTTDAPPMNEIVSADCGVLVKYERTAPRRWGTAYYVDRRSLEDAIQTVIGMSGAEKAARGERARAWFEMNDARFRRRVVDAVRSVAAATS
jgi:glycosyltransferase involved in cell wall biosynthesis